MSTSYTITMRTGVHQAPSVIDDCKVSAFQAGFVDEVIGKTSGSVKKNFVSQGVFVPRHFQNQATSVRAETAKIPSEQVDEKTKEIIFDSRTLQMLEYDAGYVEVKTIHKCLCKNIVCQNRPKDGQTCNDCMTIMPRGKHADSPSLVSVLIQGPTSECQNYASQYNARMSKKHMGTVEDYCKYVKQNMSSNDPCDKAFRMISFTGRTFFGGMSRAKVRECLDSNSGFVLLANTVRDSFATEFYKECREFKNICDEFNKVNQMENGMQYQLTPYFSLSWEVAGNHGDAHSSNIVTKQMCEDDVRLFQYSVDPNADRPCDKGYMRHIFDVLSRPDTSIVLQVMIPDGRWIETWNGFKRYSDIQLSMSARGKAYKSERDHRVAAQREAHEELDSDIPLDAFEDSRVKWGNPKKGHKLFDVDVSNVCLQS